VKSGIWEERWTKHLATKGRQEESVDEVWRSFIDELTEVVTEDGAVDFREPENIEAWVGPPWVTLQLEREKSLITARFWTQNKDFTTKHLFDRTLRIEEGRIDLTEFGASGLDSAAKSGAVIGRFLFSLRTMED
jgi:hypothetical protein